MPEMPGFRLKPTKLRYVMSQLAAMLKPGQKDQPKVAFNEYLYRPDEPNSPTRFKFINSAKDSIEDNYFMRRRARIKAEGLKRDSN